MTISQIYMLTIFILYFGVLIGLRSYLLHRKTKVNPVKRFGAPSSHNKAERLIQFGVFLMFVVVANFCFIDDNYKYLVPLEFLIAEWLSLTGFLLSIIGLGVGWIAQSQMGQSWRLGIDKAKPEKLVTSGIYQYSRNPVYVSLGLVYVGFFFIAPNLVSFLFLIIMTIAIALKVKDEEAFLSSVYPDDYLSYRKKVRRWL